MLVLFIACLGTLGRIGPDHKVLMMTFLTAAVFTIIWKIPNK
jgi:hypothetical protein